MDNKILLDKIERFLLEIFHEIIIKKNNRIKLRLILIKHKISDSGREALYQCNILKKEGYGTGSEYEWISGLPDKKMCNDFLTKMREINLDYCKKYRPKSPVPTTPELSNEKSKVNPLLPISFLIMLLLLIRKLIK